MAADVQTIKAMLLNSAYEAAIAAVENATPVGADGKPLPVVADPTVQDPGLRAKNLAIYEVAKVHYTALVNAFQDQTGVWPDPKLPTVAAPVVPTSPVPSPGHDISQIAGAVAGIAGAIAPVVPAAGVVGQVAGVVSNTLAGAGK